MSAHTNQTILDWHAVENLITRHTPKLYEGNTALNDEAILLIRDAYMLWYLVTLDSLHSSGIPFLKQTSNRWLVSIGELPVRELVDLLKDASHLLITGDFVSYDAFKQHLRSSYSTVGAILTPMKKNIHLWFAYSDTEALNLCYSWLLFLSRLNLPGLDTLETEALEKYLAIEQDIQEDGFTSEEITVLEKWFPRSVEDQVFFKTHFRPQHGPGCTADAGIVLQDKYSSLGSDPRISILINRVYGDESPYPRNAVAFTRCSKTIFVPKSLGSYRTISMEPATLMWHQKGVRNAILSYWRRRNPVTRRRHYLTRRYQPENQQPNCDLAFEGSINGDFSTIDLSSASDTVSWNLVKMWFRNTSLYPWLLLTRSTHTELPTGEVIKLRKFAPMGSDLCFPIETIIFAAITECAIRECGEDPVASRYLVYGDDIVVEDAFSSTVLRRLEANGFKPNWSKTFAGKQPKGYFRESCGSFFFDGVDITPTRLSRRFSGYSKLGRTTPKRIESIIELANDCFSRYPSVRLWLVHCLLQLPTHIRPPFSRDGSIGLFSLQPTNFHLLNKESADLQTIVHTFGAVTTRRRSRGGSWEDIRLYEYLRQTDGRQRLIWPEDRVSVDVSPIPKPSWKSRKASLY